MRITFEAYWQRPLPALQVRAAAQNRPAQQRCPAEPQASQVLEAQVKPPAQKSPLRPLQHFCASPPQATQVLLLSMVEEAVQSTPPPQSCWPGSPHWPALQPPAEQVPWPAVHAEPLATQRLELLSQHPPAWH